MFTSFPGRVSQDESAQKEYVRWVVLQFKISRKNIRKSATTQLKSYSESSDFSFEGSRSFGTKSILAICSGLKPAAIKVSAVALCCAL
jgi:hypothetical protein